MTCLLSWIMYVVYELGSSVWFFNKSQMTGL